MRGWCRDSISHRDVNHIRKFSGLRLQAELRKDSALGRVGIVYSNGLISGSRLPSGGDVGRGDGSDAEWSIVGMLLPSERGRKARPLHDNRLVLNGMLQAL